MTAAGREKVVWVAFGAVLALVAAFGAWSLVGARREPSTSLPRLGEVPPFRLTERSGRTVSRADLAGRPWVADFIFTRCSGVCPVLSSRMAKLARAVAESGSPAVLVSFSVDPTRDTPEVLRTYAERYRADPERWLFLTGDRDALYQLVGEGFRLSVAERSPEETPAAGDLITHSDRFVLVDGAARIRAYYHGTEPDVVEQIVGDLGRLGGSP